MKGDFCQAIVLTAGKIMQLFSTNRSLQIEKLALLAQREVLDMFFGKPWETWIDQYQESHQNKVNQICHFFGIPMIAASLPILLISIFLPGLFWWGICLFVIGWILQFVGHIAEGKPPEFLQDWRFLFVGLRWWIQKFIQQK